MRSSEAQPESSNGWLGGGGGGGVIVRGATTRFGDAGARPGTGGGRGAMRWGLERRVRARRTRAARWLRTRWASARRTSRVRATSARAWRALASRALAWRSLALGASLAGDGGGCATGLTGAARAGMVTESAGVALPPRAGAGKVGSPAINGTVTAMTTTTPTMQMLTMSLGLMRPRRRCSSACPVVVH
jgi:hypothetical protein